MNQKDTPLFNVIENHILKKPVSFHVPGHKNGSVFPKRGQDYFKKLLSIDVTELAGLDDLHEPEGAILEAEILLSQLYGSKRSYFLVNGSTVGNLAMVLSICKANDVVLVQRNCHKSIMNALQLAGAKPVFLAPEFDPDVQVATYIRGDIVEKALLDYPDAKAIILTNPNYYGHSIDLKPIIQLAHSREIPVLVDEAHGAHFEISNAFPESAVHMKADIVVQSAHKTLPAMTMGSFLHFQSELVSIQKVEYYLRMLQSSSPSYPIMASLDLARYFVAELKEKDIHPIRASIEKFKTDLNNIPQIKVVSSQDHLIQQDCLKITIQSCCNLSGFELQSLFERVGLFVELADPVNVLLICPLASFQYEEIVNKLAIEMSKYTSIEETTTDPFAIVKNNRTIQSIFPYSYEQLKYLNIKENHILDCINKISAETITPYPPGIPLVLKGEIITKEHVQLFQLLCSKGAKFQGLRANDKLYTYEFDKEESYG